MRVVNIDPRRTATTDLADLHLQIAPDGDVALFNSLLAHIADAGGVDANYTAAHVNGVEAAIAKAREADPADTGLAAAALAEFLALWAQTEKVVTVYSQAGGVIARCGARRGGHRKCALCCDLRHHGKDRHKRSGDGLLARDGVGRKGRHCHKL